MSQIGFNAGGGCGVPEPCCIKEVTVVDGAVTITLNNGNTFPVTPEQVLEAYGDEIVELIKAEVVPKLALDVFKTEGTNPEFSLGIKYDTEVIDTGIKLEPQWDTTGDTVGLIIKSDLQQPLI